MERSKRMNSLQRLLFHMLRGLLRLTRPCLDLLWVRHSTDGVRLERIAVLLDSGVGDTLMATPMLRELRRQLPDATILAVVNRGTAQVLTGNPDVDRLCIFRDSGSSTKLHLRALRAMRAFRPQAMIVPQTGNILIQIFAAYYSAAPMRVKHRFHYPAERRYSDFEFLFTHSPEVVKDTHRIRDNLDLLDALGLQTKTSNWSLSFSIMPWHSEGARTLLEAKSWKAGTPSVVMHPGVGTATLNKQWPAERFGALGQRLIADHGVQIVLVGGKAEGELCRQVAASIGQGCFVIAGECLLAETAAVIKLGQFFVSNDSGLMHLAASVGARGLALFAKTNPKKIGPTGGHIGVLQAPSLEELTVEKVIAEIIHEKDIAGAKGAKL